MVSRRTSKRRHREGNNAVRKSASLAASVAMILSCEAWAVDCSEVRPATPQNTDVSLTGKLEARVDGLFKKLVSPQAEIEGSYRKVATDLLPEFPNADRVFVWQQVLFLQCQLLNEDTSMSGGAHL